MPKEIKPSMSRAGSAAAPADPYMAAFTPGQRNAAIWSSADDEVLLHARSSGLNWQPIASRHFPNKTANACRKRHERLIERRHVEDWDAQKLELLAEEYLACRKEMWEMLASKVGERWAVVEAKCLEKGLKSLQATARMAQRKASAGHRASVEDPGISDQHSDSGIGICSDTEMDVGEDSTPRQPRRHFKSSSWHAPPGGGASQAPYEHVRSQSLPQPLPLYQPPPPVTRPRHPSAIGEHVARSPENIFLGLPVPGLPTSSQRSSPESNGRGGISIQSMLSPAEPQ